MHNVPPPAQAGQCSADLTFTALSLHCSTVAPFLSHQVAGPSGSSLSLLSFVLPRDLLFHSQWNAAIHFAPPVLVAYFPHWPWTSSHCVLVFNCNSFPQHRPALEGLHNTTSVTPFLDTCILCSDRNHLPKLVSGFYTSLCQRCFLKELEHWLLRCISVLKTLKANETTTYV